MPTRDELLAQLNELDEQDKKLKQEMRSFPKKSIFEKTKTYNGTKIAIAVIVVFLAIIGTLGSMKWGIFSSFDMDSFVKFLSAYQGIFITLTGSVGVGGIVKNVLKGKSEGSNGNGNGSSGETAPTEEPPVAASTGNSSKSSTHAVEYVYGEDLAKRGAGV